MADMQRCLENHGNNKNSQIRIGFLPTSCPLDSAIVRMGELRLGNLGDIEREVILATDFENTEKAQVMHNDVLMLFAKQSVK